MFLYGKDIPVSCILPAALASLGAWGRCSGNIFPDSGGRLLSLKGTVVDGASASEQRGVPLEIFFRA